jgi:hypothetical protein
MGNFLYSKVEKDILVYHQLDDENEYKKAIIEKFQTYKNDFKAKIKICMSKGTEYNWFYFVVNNKIIVIHEKGLICLIDEINRPYIMAVSDDFTYMMIYFVYNLPQKIVD